MHIVHYNLTTTTKEGGVETFVWDLAGEQARSGHRVTIVGGVGSVRRHLPGVAVWTVPFIPRERFAVGPLRRAYAWRKLAERLSMLPAAWPLLRDADLVHIHKPYDLVLGPWLRRRQVPLIYHGHGEDFFPGDTRLMRSAAALLSCSAYNAQTLAARYQRQPTIVYNGVDVQHFQPQPADSTLRQTLLHGASTLLVVPGRMMPWKGHAHVISALAELRDPALKLVFIGAGEARPALEQQARELDLVEQVAFLGTIPHRAMPRYLSAADLVIGASFASETFGMALAEALACERAVIASSWRGYDDVVRDGQTGLRFQAQSPSDLARAIATLTASPELRQRYAQAGRQRVLELFAWPAVAARVQHVYTQVCA